MTGRTCASQVFAKLFVVALAVAALIAASTAIAFAGGDAALDRLIVKDPPAGWVPLPDARIQQTVGLEKRLLSGAVDLPTTSVQVGVEGWHQGPGVLLVVLAALPTDIPFADRQARAGAISACSSATNNPTETAQPYTPIPGASEARCSGTTAAGIRISATTMSWVRGNVFAILVGIGLPRAQFEAISSAQDAAISAAGVHQRVASPPTTAATPHSAAPTPVATQHSGGSDTARFLGLAAVGVVLAGVAIFVIARARRRPASPGPLTWSSIAGPPAASMPSVSAAPLPGGWPPSAPTPAAPIIEPGWHPNAADPSQYAYWDGTRWTAWRTWDGQSWVDSSAGAP